MVKAYIGAVPGNCGILLLSGHNNNRQPGDYWAPTLTKTRLANSRNTGFGITGFVNEPRCKAVYNWLIKNYEIVYQSPVRRNRNTGHDFFFVVFDTRTPAKKVTG